MVFYREPQSLRILSPVNLDNLPQNFGNRPKAGVILDLILWASRDDRLQGKHGTAFKITL